MSMNRQLRRAQEKQEKKVEREKQERRDERKKRLESLRRQRERQRASALARKEAAKSGDSPAGKPATTDGEKKPPAQPAAGRRDPGRFSGALAIATIFFILLQAAVPTDTERFLDTIVKAGFYLMLGYFMTMWLTRRGQQNSVLITLITGFALLAGTWVGAFMRPEIQLDTLALILGVPLLLGGIWLGRLVSTQVPS